MFSYNRVRTLYLSPQTKSTIFFLFRKILKACIILSPLLGLTWVFGLLAVTDAGLVFQYIFTILNSTQVCLLYSQECFTGKYTTRKIHTKLHPGPKLRIFHISHKRWFDDAISRFFTVVCVNCRWKMASDILYNKKKFTRWLEDMNFIFSCKKQYFIPRKQNIHIFAPPSNILYILARDHDLLMLANWVLCPAESFQDLEKPSKVTDILNLKI